MREDKKVAIRERYEELLEMQQRLRTITQIPGVNLQLLEDPEPPETTDDLASCMSVIRSNIVRTRYALDAFDRMINGAEVRTREQVSSDLAHDLDFIYGERNLSDPRTNEEIEGNIAYDRLQLGRM